MAKEPNNSIHSIAEKRSSRKLKACLTETYERPRPLSLLALLVRGAPVLFRGTAVLFGQLSGLLYVLSRSRILSSLSLALNHVEVPALKVLGAVGAVCERFGVCFAPYLIVEKHPLVLSFNPPELPPDWVLLLARTI